VAIGVPAIAAPTDEEADFLASSTYQRVLGILTGERKRLQPPVQGYYASLPGQARAAVDDFLAAAAIGGPERVRARLQHLAELTEADELILVSDVHDADLRLRSLQIVADVVRQPG
jgi:alkanesulfonate monooxygenase SsuD/methylene tetrahydromethanopterin reductase-like flavin-dependent oxidoreductase (luciferase family)